jgi:tetratricopeptide (TPR) repeat protein
MDSPLRITRILIASLSLGFALGASAAFAGPPVQTNPPATGSPASVPASAAASAAAAVPDPASLPTTSLDAIDRARKLVAEGKLDDAVTMLSAFYAEHPKDLDAARYLGDLYYRQADLPNAERIYRTILKDEPLDRETHDRLGGIYAAEDRVSEAIDEFTRSLPAASNAYAQLVELHRRNGDLASFIASTKSIADHDSLDYVANYNIGMIYNATHDYHPAALYLERARSNVPNDCTVLAAMGSVYLDLGNPQLALEDLDRCLARDADNYPALVNRGDLYIELAQLDKARVDLEHAQRTRPDGAEALVDLGYLEDLNHNWHAAIADYLHAIALDPLMREGYTNLGYDYDEHKLYALAEAAYLKGLSFAPSDGRLHYLLGTAYADQGKRTLAVAEYRRAASSDETDVARAAARQLAILQHG